MNQRPCHLMTQRTCHLMTQRLRVGWSCIFLVCFPLVLGCGGAGGEGAAVTDQSDLEAYLAEHGDESVEEADALGSDPTAQ